MKTILLLLFASLFIAKISFAEPLNKAQIDSVISTLKEKGLSSQATTFLNDAFAVYLAKAKSLQTSKNLENLKKEVKKQALAEKFNAKAYNKAVRDLNSLNSSINREMLKVVSKSFAKLNKKDKEILANVLYTLLPMANY